MVDVEAVETDNFFKIGNFATTRDLPESGDTWFDTDTTFVVCGVLVVFVDGWWACANERHTAFQNIKELWKLVDAGLAKKLANFSNSRVVFHLKHETLHFILRLKVVEAFFGILVHGAEFIDVKIFTIAADAFLFEDDGSRVFKEDERGDDETKEQANETADEGAADVHEAFDE